MQETGGGEQEAEEAGGGTERVPPPAGSRDGAANNWAAAPGKQVTGVTTGSGTKRPPGGAGCVPKSDPALSGWTTADNRRHGRPWP